MYEAVTLKYLEYTEAQSALKRVTKVFEME